MGIVLFNLIHKWSGTKGDYCRGQVCKWHTIIQYGENQEALRGSPQIGGWQYGSYSVLLNLSWCTLEEKKIPNSSVA